MKSLFVVLGILIVSSISTAQTRTCFMGTTNIETLIEIENEISQELQRLIAESSKPNLTAGEISYFELQKGLSISDYIKCDAALGYALRASHKHPYGQ